MILVLADEGLIGEMLAFWLTTAAQRVAHTAAIADGESTLRNDSLSTVIICGEMLSCSEIADRIARCYHTSQNRELRIVLITAQLDPTCLVRLLLSGISGIIHWQDNLAAVIESMDSKSLHYLSPKIAKAIASEPTDAIKSLTTCEKNIARLILNGLDSRSIARKLQISERTVENHRKSIREKLNLQGGKRALTTEVGSFAYWFIFKSIGITS